MRICAHVTSRKSVCGISLPAKEKAADNLHGHSRLGALSCRTEYMYNTLSSKILLQLSGGAIYDIPRSPVNKTRLGLQIKIQSNCQKKRNDKKKGSSRQKPIGGLSYAPR